ncbi:BLUF domain-containing protein [Tamlana sp. 62-3]|uniref:BLUF domain-containing protein n=1 Tax=Neotamlana sargassicola TaxID=2883125 RepID=A0A9X1I8I3_9FLAO|nr:BLUF domain-containing protein [Tamlana sargassicola]MCB4808096.1 BLUF domain-containing protein [Tamlana sargassicola]
MLRTIAYKSKVKSGLSILSTEMVFKETLSNNFKHNITGVLVKNKDIFFQIIEGDSNLINQLFKKITNDSRHNNIIQLVNGSISSRSFSNFKAGYTVIEDSESIYELHDYLLKLNSLQAENSTLFLEIVEELLEAVQ